MVETCCTCHRPGASEAEALQLDLDVAQSALREGDLPHARHHVAGALGQAPTDPRAHTVFEALAQRMDLTLAPESGWFGEFAMIAFALYRAGQRGQAMRMLSQVARVAPHLGYEHVLTGWVAESSELVDDQATEGFARTLSAVLSSTIGFNRLHPGERALLASFAGLANALSQLERGDPQVLTAVSGVLRRSGRVAEALAIARRIPGVLGRIQEGLALRVLGEGALACEAFEAAAAADHDPSLYAVDRARCQYVAGKPAGALALLQPLGDQDPEVAGLRAACREPLPDPLARVDRLDELRRGTGYFALDRPADPTANLLSDPQNRVDKPVRTAVAGWECPTNRLLLALLAGHTDVRRVDYSMVFTDFERPVLRQVRGLGPLWLERQGVVVQAHDAPPGNLRSALARVAAGRTGTRASRLAMLFEGARRLSASALELQAASVHPPAELAQGDVAEGVYLYQLACACALTSLPSREGLQALESLIFGPVDWVSGAAIVALGEWVRAEPSVANPGRALLLAAVDDLLPHQCEPRFWPLVGALKYLPCVPPRAHDVLQAWFTKTFPEEQQN